MQPCSCNWNEEHDMLLKKLCVYAIEWVHIKYKEYRTEVRLYNYHKIATIGSNFCSTAYNRLSGENLLIYNRSSPDSIIIGDNVILECKINCNREGKIIVGDYTSIRESSVINCDQQIVIGRHCFIGNHVLIQDNDSHPESPSLRRQQSITVLEKLTDTYQAPRAPIEIEDRVWIGTGAIILKGVTIGEGAIIGAHSVVTRDVPPMSLAAGNPAKVIRPLAKE